MNIQEARDIIQNEPDAEIGRLWHATAAICSEENKDLISLEEIVGCLRAANRFEKKTVVDEIAALTLYARTGRERKKNHQHYEDLITDADDWMRYLNIIKS